MSAKKGTRSSLLLIELIITLFFFLLISMVCMQIFAKTYSITRSSRELNQAQTLTSGAAEVLEYAGSSFDHWQNFFPEIESDHNTFRLYYDQNFTLCDSKEALYTLDIEFFPGETGSITFSKGDELIYSLQVRYHIPRRLENEKEDAV